MKQPETKEELKKQILDELFNLNEKIRSQLMRHEIGEGPEGFEDMALTSITATRDAMIKVREE